MQFLLSHWHCILPVAGIIVAAIFIREEPKNKDKIDDSQKIGDAGQ